MVIYEYYKLDLDMCRSTACNDTAPFYASETVSITAIIALRRGGAVLMSAVSESLAANDRFISNNPKLRTIKHTSSTTCRYLPGFYTATKL